MKVFLAGIMQGSLAEAAIHGQNWREPIKQALLRHVPGVDIYCHYTRHPNSIDYDLPKIRDTLAQGNRMAAGSDLLVAYLPSASMGTAIEMHEAARAGAVILTISPMAPNWVIRAYSDRVFPDIAAFEAFLAAGELVALVKAKHNL